MVKEKKEAGGKGKGGRMFFCVKPWEGRRMKGSRLRGSLGENFLGGRKKNFCGEKRGAH